MKLRGFFLYAFAGVIFTAIGVFAADTNTIVTTPPVYVPDMSHASGPLPDGILVWDGTTKETNVTAEATEAHFVFSFTNISTNPVVFLSVRTSCGCTTAKLPPLPWTVPAGTNAQFDVTVNLAGRSGTLLKTVTVSTDKGSKMLVLKITILPPVTPVMSEADRLRAQAVARVNRQAVFQGECAICHVKRGTGKYGQALYEADCAICHESRNRAAMVPDLHVIKTPTNYEFWRTWITHGKPGSLMPAFSTADGGPLPDMQIASLVSYLNRAIPSQAPSLQ
jgi:mono/diheme cytochrome c family protein